MSASDSPRAAVRPRRGAAGRRSLLVGARHAAFGLANGVRAVLLARPRSPTFALQLLVRAGSRHDGPYPGLAHLVEHLVFRAPGGARVDLFGAVEGLGGEVSASTGRDYTTFEIVVAARDAEQALALLPALARPPATDAASVAGERQVVCHELRERTAPAEALWDLLLAALWGDDPLVHAPAGTVDGVLAAPAEAAAALHTQHYRPPGLVVAAAGACAPAAFRAAVAASLGALPAGPVPPNPMAPRVHARALRGVAAGGTTYLAVGCAVAGGDTVDSAALRLLAAGLGQGGQGRLARALTARGLHAVAQGHYAPYAGAGALAALAATTPAEAEAVDAVLIAELQRLASEPLADDELAAARARYVGALYRRCESNLGLATTAGAEALFAGEGPPLARTLEQVATVSVAEVGAVAARYLTAPPARARLDPRGG